MNRDEYKKLLDQHKGERLQQRPFSTLPELLAEIDKIIAEVDEQRDRFETGYAIG